MIVAQEDVAVLYGWELESTSGRWIARVDIQRNASSVKMIDFWVDGSAVPRIRSFAKPSPTQLADEKVMRALTMVIQDRIRIAFDDGELVGPVRLSPEEIDRAIDYVKAGQDLDMASVPETRLWPIERQSKCHLSATRSLAATSNPGYQPTKTKSSLPCL